MLVKLADQTLACRARASRRGLIGIRITQHSRACQVCRLEIAVLVDNLDGRRVSYQNKQDKGEQARQRRWRGTASCFCYVTGHVT